MLTPVLEQQNVGFYPEYQESWCLGHILYGIVFGLDCFRNDVELEFLDVYTKMKKYQTEDRRFKDVSDDTIQSIKVLLNRNQHHRIKLVDVGNVPLLRGYDPTMEKFPQTEIVDPGNIISKEMIANVGLRPNTART